MARKFWSILVSIYYVSYLIVVLPFLLLYFSSFNIYRRRRNKRIIKRILENSNMPRDLRKEVTKSYKKSLKILSLRNLVKNQNIFGDSKKDDGEESPFKITIGK